MFSQLTTKTKIVIAICLVFFLVSLFFTAFSYNSDNEGNKLHETKGFETLVSGSLALIGGGLYEWLIWLANPLFLLSIILLNERRKIDAFLSSLGAVALAALFIGVSEILVSESGNSATIQSRGAAYYIWISVFIIWLVYLVIGKNIIVVDVDPENNK